MKKSELIAKIHDRFPNMTNKDIDKSLGIIFDEISNALCAGERVELRGFGAFSVRRREGRMGRNPRTGEATEIPAKNVPYFRPGKDLKERVNG